MEGSTPPAAISIRARLTFLSPISTLIGMAADTQKMGLHTWDKPLDPYDYIQLTNNWQIVDFHDHSPGRGVQISQSGIAAGAVGLAQLASNVPLVPIGGMILWGVTTPPPGYLTCDGTAYQISLYSALNTALGGAFNNSPPSGYFNVPNIAPQSLSTGSVHWVIKY